MNFKKSTNGILAAAMALTASVASSTAHAHIDLDTGGTHMSRYGGVQIKNPPCGQAGATRGTDVYTYRPGETINITLYETIPHPGYFRIAFDADGDDDFMSPRSLDPQFGACNAGDANCGPGKADFCNNEAVLLDYLTPHAAAGFNTPRTFTVTLPDVECDNCTLQIIQVMEDLGIHGTAYAADDLYYSCIDLVLSAAAPEVTVTPVQNDGMDCTTLAPSADAGVADAGLSGGSGGIGGAGGTGGVGNAGFEAPPTGGVGGTGTAGAAGVSAPAGSGGAGSAPVPTTGAPTGGGEAETTGCHAAGSSPSTWASLLLGLLVLARRRSRARSGSARG